MEIAMETKKCTHCGEHKPVDQFRRYYGGRKGTYRYCKSCERLITRYRYLVGKDSAATQQECEELAKLRKLFDLRHELGLETPLREHRAEVRTSDLLDEQLEKAEAALNEGM